MNPTLGKPESPFGQKFIRGVINKTRTIKAAVKPSSKGRHPMTFMSMLGGIPSIKMAGLGSRFQASYNDSVMLEEM